MHYFLSIFYPFCLLRMTTSGLFSVFFSVTSNGSIHANTAIDYQFINAHGHCATVKALVRYIRCFSTTRQGCTSYIERGSYQTSLERWKCFFPSLFIVYHVCYQLRRMKYCRVPPTQGLQVTVAWGHRSKAPKRTGIVRWLKPPTYWVAKNTPNRIFFSWVCSRLDERPGLNSTSGVRGGPNNRWHHSLSDSGKDKREKQRENCNIISRLNWNV